MSSLQSPSKEQLEEILAILKAQNDKRERELNFPFVLSSSEVLRIDNLREEISSIFSSLSIDQSVVTDQVSGEEDMQSRIVRIANNQPANVFIREHQLKEIESKIKQQPEYKRFQELVSKLKELCAIDIQYRERSEVDCVSGERSQSLQKDRKEYHDYIGLSEMIKFRDLAFKRQEDSQ